VQTPEPTPHLPGAPPTPPALTDNTFEAQPPEMVNLPARKKYTHTAFPRAEFFVDDEDTEHDTDFDPEMLTDGG
jgi:hypothetical protein